MNGGVIPEFSEESYGWAVSEAIVVLPVDVILRKSVEILLGKAQVKWNGLLEGSIANRCWGQMCHLGIIKKYI